jgi:hydroxypyruvate isomerase
MIKFAANLSFLFNEYEFMDRFAAAADAGFTAVEYLFPYDYAPDVIAERLASLGLTQALFNCPAGDWAGGQRGITALADPASFQRSFQTAMTYAQALGAQRVHLMAGIASRATPGVWETYAANVGAAAEAAANLGVDVLLEPINGRDMPGYLLDDFDLATDLIQQIDLPNLRLQFDIYHRQVMRGDVLTALRRFAPIIGHVQIAGVPDRHEPGSGELNDVHVLTALSDMGYQGFVGCEYRPRASTREGLGWMAPLLADATRFAL